VTALADFQEQLQAILGNPEAMGQITNLARALTGGGAVSTPPPSPPAPPPETEPESGFVPVETAPPVQTPVPPVQNAMPDLSQLFQSMGGGGLPNIDPRLISIAMRVYQEYQSGDDQKTALLTALKPFLREERREKIDKAVQIARLSRVVRVALQLLKEEGGNHV